jgi:hypothetical protein
LEDSRLPWIFHKTKPSRIKTRDGIILEIEYFRVRSQIDKVRSTVHCHVAEKVVLVNLTRFGTGNSDPDGDLAVHQVRKVIIRAVAGWCRCFEVPGGIGPQHPVINKKNIYGMPFLSRYFSKLKAAGCLLIVIR